MKKAWIEMLVILSRALNPFYLSMNFATGRRDSIVPLEIIENERIHLTTTA